MGCAAGVELSAAAEGFPWAVPGVAGAVYV